MSVVRVAGILLIWDTVDAVAFVGVALLYRHLLFTFFSVAAFYFVLLYLVYRVYMYAPCTYQKVVQIDLCYRMFILYWFDFR